METVLLTIPDVMERLSARGCRAMSLSASSPDSTTPARTSVCRRPGTAQLALPDTSSAGDGELAAAERHAWRFSGSASQRSRWSSPSVHPRSPEREASIPSP